MKHSSGMAVILLLIMMGLAGSMLLHRWFVRSWIDDVLTSRESWYDNFYRTELMLDATLVWIKHHEKLVFVKKEPRVLDCSSQQATISLLPVKLDATQKIVQVTDKKTGFCLSCIITSGEGVSAKKTLTVSCFTLGRIV